MVRSPMLVQLKCSTARSRPAAPSRRARSGSDTASVSAAARSETKRSGSTGVPLTVYLDRDRVRRNQAGVAASLTYAGADPFADFRVDRGGRRGRVVTRAEREHLAARIPEHRETV